MPSYTLQNFLAHAFKKERKKQKVHLSMKEGSLFCSMRSTKPGCFRSCSWCLWKALNEEGALAWFHDSWTCGVKVLEY
jgi:hypothetical protein